MSMTNAAIIHAYEVNPKGSTPLSAMPLSLINVPRKIQHQTTDCDDSAHADNGVVSQLSKIVLNEDPFKSLQFPTDKKEFIRRLVEGFKSDRNNSYDDVVDGKGKGLIFLLYGPPGLGKALTTGKSFDEHANYNECAVTHVGEQGVLLRWHNGHCIT